MKMNWLKKIIKKSNPVPVGSTAPCTYAGDDTINIVHGYPVYMDGKPHTGIDLSCKPRHDVVAVGDGVVWDIRFGTKKLTSYVALQIDGDIIYYKHTSPCKDLCIGTPVKCGEVIGNVKRDLIHWAGYHLHFQINDGRGTKNDPIMWLLRHQPMLKYKFSQYTMVGKWYAKKSYYKKMRLA